MMMEDINSSEDMMYNNKVETKDSKEDSENDNINIDQARKGISTNSRSGHMEYNINIINKKILINNNRVIGLDTLAGISIFKSNLMIDRYRCPKITVNGVKKGSSSTSIQEKGISVLGIETYISDETVGNILSFGDLRDNSYYIYYNWDEDRYEVQLYENGETYYFNRTRDDENFYLCDLDHDVDFKNIFITTVEDRKRLYTKREIRDSNRARQLQRKLGFLSTDQLSEMISRGMLKNCDITKKDVMRAKDIYGQDIAEIKGKSTMRKGEIVREDDIIKNNRQIEDIVCYTDIMFVNSKPFLVTVFSSTDYTIGTKLVSKKSEDLVQAFSRQVAEMRKQGFKVTTMFIDREPGMILDDKVITSINNMGIDIDSVGSGQAVPVIERKIRTIKERIRCGLNSLPYKLTSRLEDYLVLWAISRVNLQVSSNSYDYCSPREKAYNRRVDVTKDAKHEFGQYVQIIDNDSNNSMKERSRGGIALMPTGSIDGSWIYYCLDNGSLVRRLRAIELPIPNEVIDRINMMCNIDNKNIKVKSGRYPTFKTNWDMYDTEDNNVIEENEFVHVDDIVQPTIQPAAEGNVYMGMNREMEEEIINEDTYVVTDNNPEMVRNIEGGNEVENNIFKDDVQLQENDNINEGNSYDENDNIDNNNDDNNDNDDNNNDDSNNDNNTGNNENIMDGADHSDEVNDEVIKRRYVRRTMEPTKMNLRSRNKEVTPGIYESMIVNKGKEMNNIKNHTILISQINNNKNMSIQEAIDKLGERAVTSIEKEMRMIKLEKNAIEGVKLKDLSYEQKRKIIPSKLFLKEKYTASGEFEKLKARMVAGGHKQERTVNEQISSATVSTSSVFMVANIAAKERRAVAVIDFPGAYLNSPMPKEQPTIHMRLNKFLTQVVCKLDDNYKQYVNDDGTSVVKLNKALYGCIQSSKIWYDTLTGKLVEIGFQKNLNDDCVWNRIDSDGNQCTVVIHVDDLMITARDENILTSEIKLLQDKFGELTITRGKTLNYLGMTFDFSVDSKVRITMDGFVEEMLGDLEGIIDGEVETPCRSDIFKVRENGLINDTKKDLFHSTTARLLYLAKRARPDLLVAVSYLTKRVQKPTNDDYSKLERAVKYLRHTKKYGITLQCDNIINILAYIDASHGVHDNMRSHTGSVVTMGKGPLYAKSSSQKINTKSSTESELVGLSDSIGQVIWARNFLIGQGYDVQAATVYQDNKSTIQLVINGKSNSERTKHIAMRYFFIKDRIDKKEVVVKYLETENMISDILTKPLQGNLFRRLRDILLNIN